MNFPALPWSGRLHCAKTRDACTTQVSTVATAAAALRYRGLIYSESGPAFRCWAESNASYLLLPASIPLLLTSAAQVDR